MNLTVEQQEVVEHPLDRHATVLAVAGSGKTSTMVHRIRFLLDRGRVETTTIRAVMYNRTARADFQRKLRALSVPVAEQSREPGVRVQTFHALGFDIVQWAATQNLRPKRFRVLNEDEELKLINRAVQATLQEAGLRGTAAENGLDDVEVRDAIHTWKAMLTPPDRAIHRLNRLTVDVYRNFEAFRRQTGDLTFDDMIGEAVQLIEDGGGPARRLANRLEHLIIDEFQDVNFANQHLARLLAGERAKVMVVGDDDQCIYEWRGARSAYIKRGFGETFDAWPHVRYRLSRTFRFGPVIAQIAANVVACNTDRQEKMLAAGDFGRLGDRSA